MVEVILLAAGSGKRLGALGRLVPKVLLPLGHRKLIDYTFDSLERAGCYDVTFVLGHRAHIIMDYVLKRAGNFSFKFVINTRFRETNNLYSVYLALQSIGTRPFIIVNGDVLFHPFLLEKLLSHEDESALLVDKERRVGEEEMKVICDEDRLICVSKKIRAELASGEYIGLAKVGKSDVELFHVMVHKLLKRPAGKSMFYEAAMNAMAGSFKIVFTEGWPWAEIDTIRDLIIARRISHIIGGEELPPPRIHSSPHEAKLLMRG